MVSKDELCTFVKKGLAATQFNIMHLPHGAKQEQVDNLNKKQAIYVTLLRLVQQKYEE